MVVCAPAAAAPDGESRSYVIAVGYNGVPPGGDASLVPLRFADDDAIAFFAFVSRAARRAHLLTVVDVDTQRRLGDAVHSERPPGVAELRGAVADVRGALEEDARAGISSEVYFYYSGHGTAAAGREPALTLIDGALTRSMLYDEVLSNLPAAHVHLFVDACHAEAVVRPRDAEAQLAPTSDDDRAHYSLASTLARFPNVGAVVAATRSAQAHEWELYLGGVFTHELLSGLRGAADVNGDDRIEYSELAAFLSAANGAVRDPRARLETVTHAPSSDPRAAIVELRRWSSDAVLEVRGVAPGGVVFVEDDHGDRLADVRPEMGHEFRLVLPADRTWYVHTSRGEAEIHPVPGARIALESVAMVAPSTRPRGALEAALHEGLFATAFGPSYYRGFIDRATDLAPVPLVPDEPLLRRSDVSSVDHVRGPSRVWGWVSAGAASALATGAGAFGWMALQARSDFDGTSIERRAADAADRYRRDTTVGAALGAGAIVAAAMATYLLLRSDHDGPAHASLGTPGVAVHF
jgi:hypothetical protein